MVWMTKTSRWWLVQRKRYKKYLGAARSLLKGAACRALMLRCWTWRTTVTLVVAQLWITRVTFNRTISLTIKISKFIGQTTSSRPGIKISRKNSEMTPRCTLPSRHLSVWMRIPEEMTSRIWVPGMTRAISPVSDQEPPVKRPHPQGTICQIKTTTPWTQTSSSIVRMMMRWALLTTIRHHQSCRERIKEAVAGLT